MLGLYVNSDVVESMLNRIDNIQGTTDLWRKNGDKIEDRITISDVPVLANSEYPDWMPKKFDILPVTKYQKYIRIP